MPLERWYVDAGSPLYVEVMNKVPVVAPKDLAFVDKTVRETSLRRMVAAPAVSAAPADDEAESAAASADPATLGDQTGPTPHELLQSVKRRRLYRRATGEEVVWLPHDNHGALEGACVGGRREPREVGLLRHARGGQRGVGSVGDGVQRDMPL